MQLGSLVPDDLMRQAVCALQERDAEKLKMIDDLPPLYDPAGTFVGAANLLIDITDRKRALFLAAQAERRRRLAGESDDPATSETLLFIADHYDVQAQALEHVH